MYYSLHIYFSILIIARKKVLQKRGMSLDYLITNNGHCKDHSFNRIFYAVNTYLKKGFLMILILTRI